MPAILRGFEFLAQSQFGKFFPSTIEEISLTKKGKVRPADVYRPKRKSLGTILVVHGMTMRGHRDPRMDNVCRALAGSGYTAVAPLYNDIRSLNVTADSVGEIAESIVRIAGDSALSPTGRIGVFSASFSAGMCLLAAADPKAALHVASMCTVGTLGAVDSTVEFLLGHEGDIDDYGTVIMFLNFIKYSIGKNPKLEKAFEIAAYDNGLRREVPLLPAHLKTLPRRDQLLFDRIRNRVDERMKHFRKIQQSKPFKDLVRGLAVEARLSQIKAAVSLIHGIDDNVIPPSESQHVHDRLKSLGVDTKLTFTPLISHGDATIGLSMVKEIYHLAAAFGFFFAHLEKGLHPADSIRHS